MILTRLCRKSKDSRPASAGFGPPRRSEYLPSAIAAALDGGKNSVDPLASSSPHGREGCTSHSPDKFFGIDRLICQPLSAPAAPGPEATGRTARFHAAGLAPRTPSLGTAGDLLPPTSTSPSRPALEAQEGRLASRWAVGSERYALNAPPCEGFDECFVDDPIGSQAADGQGVTFGHGKTVGHFQVVQDGAAAAAAPDRRATAASRVLPAIGIRLKIAQRQASALASHRTAASSGPSAASSNSASLTAMFQRPAAGGSRRRRKDEG